MRSIQLIIIDSSIINRIFAILSYEYDNMNILIYYDMKEKERINNERIFASGQ